VGQLISFEKLAVARLREQLGLVEEANEDLIAFARGHSGAVASIHAAVLAAVEASSIEELLHVVSNDWPPILGIDSAAVALVVGKRGFRADCSGIERVEAAFVERMLGNARPVDVHSVSAGHPLFGEAADKIRAQALIRIDSRPPYPRGLLALGQHDSLELDSSHGSELLHFLGAMVAGSLRRFVATA
jgi:uncharacterized protein